VIAAGLAILSVPILGASAYLLVLALFSGRRPSRHGDGPRRRFVIIVPAHDEAGGIGPTLSSLHALDYPIELRRIRAIADNCTDDTAAVAATAGAEVWERRDPGARGKGHALAFAFARTLEEGWADGLVVVDADTTVSPNLLECFSAALNSGGRCLQAEYGVRNPDASWRTRLMTLSFALFHNLRSNARDRLGLSVGLRGNGMCFARDLLRAVPYDAFSLVEDLEYGIRLGLHGERVQYVGEAKVVGDMGESEATSRSQRRRWEGGRLTMVRTYTLPLLRRALTKLDPVPADLALDLLVPPLGYLVLAAALGTVAASLLSPARPPAFAPWLAADLMLVGYVARGWVLSGLGLRAFSLLYWGPVFVLWKLSLWIRPAPETKGEWVRTPRS
jgi:cellulose synthase/poly-beta-1,6-N-acetylglucosamine synthase-like glycosyltransferase